MVTRSRQQPQGWLDDNDGFDLSQTDDAAVSSALLSKVPKKQHVLDVGCGSGRNISLLQQHFARIALLEQKRARLLQAKKLAGKYLSTAVCVEIPKLQAEQLQLQFDCVFIHCVMGYLSRDQVGNFLKFMRGKLAADGVIVLRENIHASSGNEEETTDKDLEVAGKIEGESTVRTLASFQKIFRAAGFAHTYYGNMELEGEDGQEFYQIASFILYPM